jgi:copper homeostasis protein (lipoprotein)
MKAIKLNSVTFMVVVAVLLISCNTTSSTQNSTPVGDTTQNSLDWNGSYSGILPCADCEGIETTLKLDLNSTYVLITKYLGRKNSNEITKNGTFSWNENTIVLHGIKKGEQPSIYKVEENQLRQFDLSGKPITGGLAQSYVLSKNGNPMVEDKRWKLISLNGKAIDGTSKTHYLIFHSKDNKIEAKANCNVLLNKYSIKNNLKLKIEPGVSTLMSCPDNLEDDFKKVLFMVDNLSVSDDGKNLSLNKARMAPLAQFELVK